ncbi:hypothetical protein AwDysgo_16880 [Bacteroidales bacterium]|nr:hypothetical protein AwDysgo_16880 [Bacteroidales bacterium]
MGDYYTKGEPREASVAIAMLDRGDCILPNVYADEVAYKPPFTHWMIAVFSIPQGEVSPFTSRLPSTLAFIGMIGMVFVFYGRRLKFQEAFLTCLILMTSFELHRAAMTSRVDMVLTSLIVIGLILLYKWEEERQIKGFPILAAVFLGLAALVKGPVGIILPLLVFGIYLLVLKYKFWKIIGKISLLAAVSFSFLAIWYILAYQIEGDKFIDLVWAENIGRFFGTDNLNINYHLGHEEPLWFLFLTLITGFIPWTLLLFLSLFSVKYSLKSFTLKSIKEGIARMDKVKLFSLIASVVIVVFYCIPISKRSVYLMPAYPFLAVFMAQYILYICEYKPKTLRVFSIFIGFLSLAFCSFLLCILLIPDFDPLAFAVFFTNSERALEDIQLLFAAMTYPKAIYLSLAGLLMIAIYVLYYHLNRKNNLKILYATIGVYLALNLCLDGIILPAFKDSKSVRPIAEKIKTTYINDGQRIYVMSNLFEYSNMYGLNFYLGNNFHNFEKETPQEGFFLVGEGSFGKVQEVYGEAYDFELMLQENNTSRDGERVIQLYTFNKK